MKDRRSIASVIESLSASWKTIAGGVAFAALVAAAILVMERIADVPLDYMTEDALQTAKLPFYTGMLSYLSGMLWAGAAAICFLGAALAWKKGRTFWFFLVAGLITLWLGLDDVLLFHDQFLRYYVGIPEKPIFAAYVILFGAFVLVFLRDIAADRSFAVWLVSWLFFAASMLIDVVVSYNHVETFVEDIFKFAGIVLWTAYFFTRVVRLAKERPGAA